MIRIQNTLSSNMKKFIEDIEKYNEENNKKPYAERNIYPQGTGAQFVVNCLCDLFLGEDWCISDPLPNCQVNTIILEEILYKYNKEFRRYIKSKQKERRR